MRFLFLAVCRAISDCEDYDIISDWGEERIDFLRRYLPYEHAVPGGRWLTIVDEPDRARLVRRRCGLAAEDLARQARLRGN